MEVWLHSFCFPGRVRANAIAAEELGFDGLLVADSQNIGAEVWVELALASVATGRIKLGPGVTNPVSRHPSVTASAAATLQAESDGRVELVLSRGDSALHQIGMTPATEEELEEATRAISDYLAGRDATVRGHRSRLGWLDPDTQRVPLAVAASGPHSIAIGAAHADGIDLTVGAEPARLQWGIETARIAGDARIGAFINVAVHHDPARARAMVRGSSAIFARFSAEGAPVDGLSEVTKGAIGEIAAGYDESQHGHEAAIHTGSLADDFIDRFSVAGTPEYVAERLLELQALGIERLILVPCSLDTDPDDLEASNQLFSREVLSALSP